MTNRSRLISCALRLQWPPFTWVFRLYYWIAIQCSRFLIARVEGVRSIYVTGSWVRGDVIFGLSDIDFKILVAGGKKPEISRSIQRRFSALRCFFPVLGPPDEKGIYFLDAFRMDYRHHPLIQHLFDPRFFQHRLIWGQDLLPDLPVRPWKELDQGECAFSRLKDWIERIHVLAGWQGWSPQQRQHLYFKAVSDVALLAARMKHPEENFGKRSEILRKIQPLMEGTDRRLIDNLVRENRTLYRIPLNSNAESLRLFRRMVAFCVETISGRDGADVSPLRVECRPPRPSSEDHVIVNRLQSVCPGVRLIAGGPWPQLPLNPFDFQLFSAPVYLIESELGPEELRALRACHGDNFGNKAVLLVRDDSRFFLTSVNSDLVDHWGSFQGSSDLLHLLLSGRPGKAVTELHRQRIEARLRAFREQLSAALADPQFGRMDPAMFPLFLFNALRVLIFNRELGRGRWRWLLTPAEITDFLLNETPLRPSFPRALAEQFERATKEGARFNERLMPKSRMLLAEMMEIASSGGPLEALSKLNDVADEQRLSISAAIVTANRPAQLARCLDSLARLTRPPEELIVVN
ncbi:MAG: hypothetical protein H6Q07_1470, partial [Acidobacteria bacterium]|nr:hypothetical protein [Acidobacteriota bacterium]